MSDPGVRHPGPGQRDRLQLRQPPQDSESLIRNIRSAQIEVPQPRQPTEVGQTSIGHAPRPAELERCDVFDARHVLEHRVGHLALGIEAVGITLLQSGERPHSSLESPMSATRRRHCPTVSNRSSLFMRNDDTTGVTGVVRHQCVPGLEPVLARDEKACVVKGDIVLLINGAGMPADVF